MREVIEAFRRVGPRTLLADFLGAFLCLFAMPWLGLLAAQFFK